MELRKYHDSHVMRNEEITSALIFGRTFALAALKFHQSNDLKRLHPMAFDTLQDFVDHHCQWVWRFFERPLNRDSQVDVTRRSYTGLIFSRNSSPRFVIVIRSLLSCKVRIYNTRGIITPYKTPTDSCSHVSRESHLGEHNNSLIYTCDLLTFAGRACV